MKSKLGWIWIVFIGVVAASTDCLAGPPAKGLTEVEAALRTRQVTHLAYQISLKLDPAREDFEATTVFTFDFDKKVKSDGLFAELEEAHIKELRNGINLLSKEQIGAHYDGHRIRFASEELKPKGNRIEVVYSRAYVNNGNGLHRFKDVADGNFYHFNHFEAYYAHLVFPCFDQPDLKAQFKLKVEAPKDWEVISSAPVENTRSQDGTKTQWQPLK